MWQEGFPDHHLTHNLSGVYLQKNTIHNTWGNESMAFVSSSPTTPVGDNRTSDIVNLKSMTIALQLWAQKPQEDVRLTGDPPIPEFYYTNGACRFIVCIDKNPRASPEITMNYPGYLSMFKNDTEYAQLKYEMRDRLIFIHDEIIDLPAHTMVVKDITLAGTNVEYPTWFSTRTITKRYLFTEENFLPIIYKDNSVGSVLYNNVFVMLHTSSCDRLYAKATIEYTW